MEEAEAQWWETMMQVVLMRMSETRVTKEFVDFVIAGNYTEHCSCMDTLQLLDLFLSGLECYFRYCFR